MWTGGVSGVSCCRMAWCSSVKGESEYSHFDASQLGKPESLRDGLISGSQKNPTHSSSNLSPLVEKVNPTLT